MQREVACIPQFLLSVEPKDEQEKKSGGVDHEIRLRKELTVVSCHFELVVRVV